MGQQDLDPHLLFWDMRRKVPVDEWPTERTVVAFQLQDVAPKVSRWWLVGSHGEMDVCDFDPGYDVTATVSGSLRSLIEIWRGDVTWRQALRTGNVTVAAPTKIRSVVPSWLGQMPLAAVPRP
jgi:hypothetical protein